MDDFQLFDGVAFSCLENEPATIRTGPTIYLDLLPPCACGSPSDDTLLSIVFALLDGGFAGVRQLIGDELSTATSLLLTDSDLASDRSIWLWIDPDSIEGKTIIAVLCNIRSGTSKTAQELADHAIRILECAFTEAGRKEEFGAAVQRILKKRRHEGAKE
ncbi:MAG: hypothetical protein VCA57_19500 [Pseudomonas sp.]|uniref:hypothetical protein n=1 Tax=Pseudomonas sp. TaxID=306 RepID=UPI00398211A7